MEIHRYVYKKMSWIQRFKLYIYKKRVDRVMNKMDKHVKIAHKKQNLLERCDSDLFNYINFMNVKYA